MKYNNGDLVANGTLRVQEAKYTKIRCICTICGMEGIYNEKDIDNNCGCKYCSEFAKAKIAIKATTEMKNCDAIIDRSETGKYRSGSLILSSISRWGNLVVGQLFNNLSLRGFVSKGTRTSEHGISVGSPTHAILTCRYCGHYKRLLTIEELLAYDESEVQREKYKCPHCSGIVEKSKNEIKDYLALRSKQNKDKISKRNAKMANTVNEDGRSKISHVAKSTINNKTAEDIMKKVEKKNPTLTIRSVERAGSGFTVHCTCDICGTDVVIPSSSRTKLGVCQGCLKKETDINYVGRYYKDHTGVTKNLLTLISRDGDKCELKCETCKTIITDINFYDWYKGKAVCKCVKNNTNGDDYCASCGEPYYIPFSDIIDAPDKTKQAKCNVCKGDCGVTYQKLLTDYLTLRSQNYTKANRLGLASDNYKNEMEEITQSLFKAKKPLYVGTDDKFYYRCICLEHDTALVLNDDEISIFDHEQCAEARQHVMKDINKDNIKF